MAVDAGVDINAMADAVGKLNRRMERGAEVSPAVAKGIEQMNMTVDEFRALGADERMRAIVQTMVDMEQQARITFANQLGMPEILPVIDQIIAQGGNVNDILNAIDPPFTEKELQDMDAFRQAWDRLKDTIFIFVGRALQPMFIWFSKNREIIEGAIKGAIEGLAAKIKALSEWWNNLSSATKKFIGYAAGFAFVLGPVLSLLGGLITVISLLISPIGLVIVAIAALAAIFIYFWNTNEGFRDALIAAWEQLKEAGMAIFEAIRETIAAVAAAIKAIWEEHGEAIMAVLKPLWEQVKNTVTTAIEIVKNVILFVLAIIRGDWSAAWEALKNIGVAIWNYMKNTAINIFETLKASLSLIWAVIREQAIAIWENIKQGVIDKANALRQGVIDTVDRALQWIRELPGKAIAWGRDLIQGFIDGILGKAAELYGKIKGVIDGAITAAKNALKSDSPSRVFEAIGIDTVKGYIQGLEKMAGAVNVGLSGMVNPGGLQPAMAGAGAVHQHPVSHSITLEMRGLFDGANVSMATEQDAETLARKIYQIASNKARSEGAIL